VPLDRLQKWLFAEQVVVATRRRELAVRVGLLDAVRGAVECMHEEVSESKSFGINGEAIFMTPDRVSLRQPTATSNLKYAAARATSSDISTAAFHLCHRRIKINSRGCFS
jgi:hypothetical protein